MAARKPHGDAPRRLTIADVAREAEVSAGTVSAVLNGRGGVREETRERVLRVIDALDYQPLASARALASGVLARDRSIGMVVKESDNPFYTDVVAGVRAFLAERDYALLITSSEGDYTMEGRLIDMLRTKQTAGVIIGPVLHDEAELDHLFHLRRQDFPFVLLEQVRGLRAPVVSVDNVAAAKRATVHLLELGHERLVYLAGPPYTHHSRDRVEGVRQAFSESPLRFHEGVVVQAGASLEDGYRTARALFEGAAPEERPTALHCFNDLVAIGAMQALQQLGLDVPGQVSVLGFDGIPAGGFLAVPLTTVQVPRREIGRRAADLLLRRLDDPSAEPEMIWLDAELVQRGSTAPPPAA